MTARPLPYPRRRPARLLAFATVAALVVVAAPEALACSCMPPGEPPAERANADAVFSGRVVEVEPVGDRGRFGRLAVRFALASVWKGLSEGDEVTVTTAADGATCGYSFQQGEEYLVYAYGEPGALSTGLCTRNARLERADEDLAALGEPVRSVAKTDRSEHCAAGS